MVKNSLAVKSFVDDGQDDISSGSGPSDGGDNFIFPKSRKSEKAKTLVNIDALLFLKDLDRSMSSIEKHPLIKKVKKCNTEQPSSAPVERMFFPRRNNLNTHKKFSRDDKTFEG
ncbi:UNVERIFIED_CONTAM: hypothetical protein RMT77_003110 [Armadillidium vulgare]